jgi:hypothetical protein
MYYIVVVDLIIHPYYVLSSSSLPRFFGSCSVWVVKVPGYGVLVE